MAADFESMTLLLLVVLTIACIVQVIFVGLLLLYLKRVADTLGGMRVPASPSPAPLSPPGPVPVAEEAPGAAGTGGAGRTVEGAQPVAPAPVVDILRDSPDIQGSVRRLAEMYHLSDFIIATLDGLLVVSLYPGSSEEAARFSELYRTRKKPDAPGVTLLGISHHGETMVGIVRAEHPLSREEEKEIGEDARRILDWWL